MWLELADSVLSTDMQKSRGVQTSKPQVTNVLEPRRLPREKLGKCGATTDQIYPETTGTLSSHAIYPELVTLSVSLPDKIPH